MPRRRGEHRSGGFLLRRTPKWRVVLKDILFKKGDIVEHGEEAEDDVDK